MSRQTGVQDLPSPELQIELCANLLPGYLKSVGSTRARKADISSDVLQDLSEYLKGLLLTRKLI
jgi:hypothetical protein